MRIATPCSENLDAMPKNAQGDYLCGKCERAVVDLRRAPRKRALSVIAGLREQGDGSVCVRVNAKRDGTPVFAPDPSPFARLMGPIALVGSLAACSPQTTQSAHETTPITLTAHEDGANTNHATPTQTQTVVGTQPQPGGVQNVNVSPPETQPMAGGLAFSD